MEKKIGKIDNFVIAAVWLLLGIASATAAPLNRARVSAVIRDVHLLPSDAAPRPAVVNDNVNEKTAVRTGVESRTELTFLDQTITRLGQNTVFSFRGGSREVRLDSGAVLMQVPQGGSAAQIRTAAVTASITGGTGLLSSNKGYPTKLLILEGVGEFCTNGGDCVTLHGGEMAMELNGHLAGPFKFDVKLVYNTSHLIADFPSLPNDFLILQVIDRQQSQLGGNPPPPFWRDILDLTDQRTSAFVSPAPTATPSATSTPIATATPSKYGTPPVIGSPNPYVIGSGTTITTDPSITTNGVTDFGKIYRGPADDGPFSQWAFGSTSAFDNGLNLDSEFFSDPSNLPIAVFKFQSLVLNGNPTIDISNGGVTRLGLIGVDGITSGAAGGTLTFTGLDGLYLGTVNGSINLGSEISFQSLGVLAIYARGSGSDLIINSPILNIGELKLAAEGSLHLTNAGTMSVGSFDSTAGGDLSVQIGGSLLLNGELKLDTLVLPGSTVTSGGNVTLNVSGDLTNSSATEISRLRVKNEGGHIVTGGNILLNVGGNLMTARDFEFSVRNTAGQIDHGGNLTLSISGDAATHALSLFIENWDFSTDPAGHIGTGGNMLVTIGGNLNADSIDALINNRAGGIIGSGGNMTFNISGALTTTGDAGFIISSRYDDTGGSIIGSAIGSDVTLEIQAGSVNIGGSLISATFGGEEAFSGISNRGGTINGNATYSWDIDGDMTVHGDASLNILNDGGTDVLTPTGGILHGDALINIAAANVTTNSLSVFISNRNAGVSGPGGTIDGSAQIVINVSGDLTTTGTNPTDTAGDLDLEIQNHKIALAPSTGTGGTIGSDAAIDVEASGQILVHRDFYGLISNQRIGTIGGNASVHVFGDSFKVDGFLQMFINTNAGGLIAGSASLFAGANGDLFGHDGIDLEIDDTIFGGNVGGHIGGSATVTMDAQNIFTPSTNSGIPGTDRMAIEGSVYSNASGFVGGNASVNVSAQNITAPGSVLFWVANGNYQNLGGGTIGGDAEVNVSANSLSSGDLFTQILNYGGASIGGRALVEIDASSALMSNNLDALIDNRSGQIGSDASIDFSGSDATFTSQGNMWFRILNGPYGKEAGIIGGVINGAATIDVTAANLSAGSLLAEIDNSGGAIETDATITFNVSDTAAVSGDATFAIYGSNGAGSATIQFNGGSYDAGGTFLSYIDQNGTIAFNGSSVHADVLKVGVFGDNGVINIGGGTLSADTQLKLYAPGSNGQLNFVSNVTLGGNAAKILAANSVTIFDNVVVTIGGPTPAAVYVNFTGGVPNANYTGYGGNGSTTGTFAGQGASTPQPLANAPPFDSSSGHPTQPSTVTRPRAGGGGRGIRIHDTNQLLTLLDSASNNRNGRAIVDPRTTRHFQNANSASGNGRVALAAERVELNNRRPMGGIQLR